MFGEPKQVLTRQKGQRLIKNVTRGFGDKVEQAVPTFCARAHVTDEVVTPLSFHFTQVYFHTLQAIPKNSRKSYSDKPFVLVNESALAALQARVFHLAGDRLLFLSLWQHPVRRLQWQFWLGDCPFVDEGNGCLDLYAVTS